MHQTASDEFDPKLSWSKYCLLIQITSKSARQFYEMEAIKNHWSVRELARQIGSLLYDRLAKSKDKEGILQLATKGQEIEKPADAIKDPLIMEFLNIPEWYQLTESRLEEALIDNLQNFLLELGKGFAFVARQKRITLDGRHFYADLVFYHVILKCYVDAMVKYTLGVNNQQIFASKYQFHLPSEEELTEEELKKEIKYIKEHMNIE
ncbi:MAG: YhcG family protein [Rickettsia endosymbiont of Pseudomimeciton antennatum]|nr:YhcG family protein [Rickettsia endosymbiont of Pseudomimeciton antennatum]